MMIKLYSTVFYEKVLNFIHSSLIWITGVVFLLGALPADAGGIALGATRVIYPQGDKQTSLPIINSDKEGVFLIQSWVSDEKGNKSGDFVITPPLFVIQPRKESVLRIMYVGAGLPTDRESVFYLNSKAIPSVDKNQLTGSNLQIATQSVIKLFIRPKKLSVLSADAPKMLRCQRNGRTVTISNASPYYVTLVQLHVGSHRLPNTMVSPMGRETLSVPGNASGAITFQTINDYGANTPKQTCAN